jgi:dTDP-4-amino-4,6-dideoxygalactose transaminase
VWRGRKVGSIGDAGAFSFQASKNLCSGEGGMITTDNDDVAAAAAGLRDCGRAAGRPFYEHHRIGYNFRLTEMQGALLRSRLRLLEEETERRFRNGRLLTAKLSQLPGLRPLDPEPQPGDRRAYHLYPVRVLPEVLDGIGRDRFLEANAEAYPPGGLQAAVAIRSTRDALSASRHLRPSGSVDYWAVSARIPAACQEAVCLRCSSGRRDTEIYRTERW